MCCSIYVLQKARSRGQTREVLMSLHGDLERYNRPLFSAGRSCLLHASRFRLGMACHDSICFDHSSLYTVG